MSQQSADTVLKMNFWLIPYLVAYNVSDSSDWKYGPEHIFNVELSSNGTYFGWVAFQYVDIRMDIACRPIESKLIQCRIDSAVLDKYVMRDGLCKKDMWTHDEEYGKGSVFQVEFNEEGVTKVWFLKINGSRVRETIVAIIGMMNPTLTLGGRKYWLDNVGKNFVFGTCNTSCKTISKYSTEKQDRDVTMIEGYNLYVPRMNATSAYDMMVTEENGSQHKCTRGKPYDFLSAADDDFMQPVRMIKYPKNELYVGHKSFRAYRENVRIFVLPDSTLPNTGMITLGDIICVNLKSIRPAKEELRNTGDLANVGAGFEPGIDCPV